MGLRHSLRDAKAKYDRHRAGRFMAQLGPVACESSRQRWGTLREMLGENTFFFVATKWLLTDATWQPGEIPRRPRSAEEMAEHLGMSAEEVRRIDSEVVAALGDDPEMGNDPDWG